MRRVTTRGLLQAAAFVTVAVSLVTLLPVDHHALQLFTHFRLQYLAVSVLLLAALAYLRSPVFSATLLICALANAAVVMPWYSDRLTETGTSEIKVLYANVLRSNVEHDRLFALIAEQRPDLVFLQEVSPQWAAALEGLRGNFPHRYVEARAGSFGIALLSRLPLDSVEHVDSPPIGFPTLHGQLAVGDRALHFVSTHPMIPIGADNYAARNEQLRQIRQLLDASVDPTILVGDLNVTMWDINYRELEAATGLRNARQGHGIVPTWPTFMPFAMIPIDHVLISHDIEVGDIRTGPRIGSDHLPLIVTLRL